MTQSLDHDSVSLHMQRTPRGHLRARRRRDTHTRVQP